MKAQKLPYIEFLEIEDRFVYFRPFHQILGKLNNSLQDDLNQLILLHNRPYRYLLNNPLYILSDPTIMLSESDFNNQIAEIVSHPQNQNEWTIKDSLTPEGSRYMIKTNHKVFLNDDVLNLEFHIVRHPSYCVPVLCFHAWSSNGSMVKDYEKIWSIFKSKLSKECLESIDLYSALTQIDHPVHQTPIWALHPCKTPSLLENFTSSSNLVLTFLSTFGPFLGINVDHLMITVDQ